MKKNIGKAVNVTSAEKKSSNQLPLSLTEHCVTVDDDPSIQKQKIHEVEFRSNGNYGDLIDMADADNTFKKFEESIKIIEEAFDNYSHIALSFNGGKENTILMHLIRYCLKNRFCRSLTSLIVFNFEEQTFPEVVDFIQSQQVQFNFTVLYIHEVNYKKAFFKLKEMHPEIDAVFMGVRRTDHKYYENMKYFEETTEGWPKCMRVNPLLNWSYENVWNFLRALKIPYCSLYDHGYTSLGSANTTKKNPYLKIDNVSHVDDDNYLPAYLLKDGSLERAGREQ